MLHLTLIHSSLIVGALYGLGSLLLRCFPFLRRYNLAASVVGGLIGGLLLWLAHSVGGGTVIFAEDLRDTLLILYFVTIGCRTDLTQLRRGGRPLVVLSLLAVVLISLQNCVGVLVALCFGLAPGYGLLMGSIPFVGGFGSSAAWSVEFNAVGLSRALEMSVGCSTLGLILGGVVAGPLVAYLIQRHNLYRDTEGSEASPETIATPVRSPVTAERLLYAVALLAGSVYCGDLLRSELKAFDILLPRFLTAMIAGGVLGNLGRRFVDAHLEESLELIGDVVLHSFIILVLSGMHIWSLSALAGPLLTVAIVQTALTVAFCWRVLFRLMGRDYDAAVMAGATVGYGLSSFAVAMATAKVAVARHGPAPKAMLLLPLVGAAVVDLVNNLIVSGLFQLDWFGKANF